MSHDQKTNAYAYARSGACSVLEENNFTDGLLVSEITRIMGDQNIYDAMSAAAQAFGENDAGGIIAQTLTEIANEHV